MSKSILYRKMILHLERARIELEDSRAKLKKADLAIASAYASVKEVEAALEREVARGKTSSPDSS